MAQAPSPSPHHAPRAPDGAGGQFEIQFAVLLSNKNQVEFT
jgi:hypothetical protein